MCDGAYRAQEHADFGWQSTLFLRLKKFCPPDAIASGHLSYCAKYPSSVPNLKTLPCWHTAVTHS